MPHQYTARILWERGDQTFTDNKYSRRHVMRFDGGLDVPGSSSPLVVPLPYSDPQAVDPEEAFVASLSSCHMLWFLSIAVRSGFTVDRYDDDAVGVMTANERRKFYVSRVTLRPAVASQTEPIQRSLLQEGEHHVKAFIWVVNDDVFLTNRRKTIAVMFQYAFREARGV